MQQTRSALSLGVDQLLALPIAAEARAQLWRLALDQQPALAPEQQRSLLLALARHCGQTCAAASADGHSGLAFEQLQEVVGLYDRLAKLVPDRVDAVRQELVNLISKLIADLHAGVYCDPPPPPVECGRLCWRGHELAGILRRVNGQGPDWLRHLEEQLVRQGAIALRQLAQNPPAGTEPAQLQTWRRQALELLLHLARLHQPCPAWILQAAQELIAVETDVLLSGDRAIGSPEPEALQQLLGWVARLPLPPEQVGPLQLAAQRGIRSLQLLEQNVRPPARAVQRSATVSPTTVASRPSADPVPVAVSGSPRQLHEAIQLAVQAWLADHPAGLQIRRLEPVLRPGDPPVLHADGVLRLNLDPLLAHPEPRLLDQLVPAFFTPLQRAGRGAELQLVEPHSQLWQELCQFWQSGERLTREQWRGLVYSTALWNRCGGSGALEAQPLDWELPVAELRPGCSLLRPGNVELAALQSVLFDSDQLDDWLAEIRRRHHDRAWMEQHSEGWWYDPADGSENLRRLHTNAGFYASSHAPLESLQRWSQGTLRALLAGPVIFGNASITEMFWPVAQQIRATTGQLPGLVQWPGDQAFYHFIAGQEILFVTPLASDVEAHHRTGLAFALFSDLEIRPYGLRCIEAPVSIYPNRPDRGFEESLERTLDQIDRAYRQKPFSVFTASSGAYGLPLCEAVKQRFGVSCVYVGNQMHAYFGVLQRTTADWRAASRISEHWITSHALDDVPGIDRVEGGRYLS